LFQCEDYGRFGGSGSVVADSAREAIWLVDPQRRRRDHEYAARAQMPLNI
jgi:hypothetical protein